MSPRTRVTRLGVTNSQTKLRLHVRHDLEARILESSQTIRVEHQMLLKLLRHKSLQTCQLDLVIQLILQLLLVARHVRLPAFDASLEFQKRAPSRKTDRTQKVSFPSSCRRIVSLLQSSPGFQRILRRVGDNVVRFITRESHERRVHLLQHKLQVLHTSVQIRVAGQELEIDGSHRDLDRLLSSPLEHHLRLLDQATEECLSLLRPLLEILLFAREFLRTTQALHIDETRSVFPNLSCREIVDRSHCISESRFCSHLSSECEYLLL